MSAAKQVWAAQERRELRWGTNLPSEQTGLSQFHQLLDDQFPTHAGDVVDRRLQAERKCFAAVLATR